MLLWLSLEGQCGPIPKMQHTNVDPLIISQLPVEGLNGFRAFIRHLWIENFSTPQYLAYKQTSTSASYMRNCYIIHIYKTYYLYIKHPICLKHIHPTLIWSRKQYISFHHLWMNTCSYIACKESQSSLMQVHVPWAGNLGKVAISIIGCYILRGMEYPHYKPGFE